jgi:hypothetical protein
MRTAARTAAFAAHGAETRRDISFGTKLLDEF